MKTELDMPADAEGRRIAQQASRLTDKVFALLERAEYRRCDKGEDLEDIYRLRYKAYRSNDMIPDSASHVISDELDEAPNVHRFGVYIDRELVSTMRIHHVTRETPMSASTKAFGDIVHPMLDQGLTFVCMSRQASDPEWSKVYAQLPYLTMRLAGMACFYFHAPYGLSVVREDHAGFYKRIYYSEQISDERGYPGVYNKVILFRTDAYGNRQRFYSRFPFFQSTPVERRLLFGPLAEGELAPLTILPTAKYLSAAA
jgi:hypothetical protein